MFKIDFVAFAFCLNCELSLFFTIWKILEIVCVIVLKDESDGCIYM